MRNEAERLIIKEEMHKNTKTKEASHVCANHEGLEERRSNARGYGEGEEEENARGTMREAEEESTKASSKA